MSNFKSWLLGLYYLCSFTISRRSTCWNIQQIFVWKFPFVSICVRIQCCECWMISEKTGTFIQMKSEKFGLKLQRYAFKKNRFKLLSEDTNLRCCTVNVITLPFTMCYYVRYVVSLRHTAHTIHAYVHINFHGKLPISLSILFLRNNNNDAKIFF